MVNNQSRIIEQYKSFKVKNKNNKTLNFYITDKIIKILYPKQISFTSIAITEENNILIEIIYKDYDLGIEIEPNNSIIIFGYKNQKEFLNTTRNINDIIDILKTL